jgi:hypothetical protein
VTDREQELIQAARDGTEVVCDKDPIRADLIRELLLGKHGDLDPRGVRVTGARITEQLDLYHVTAKVGLQLDRCTFDEPIAALSAHVPWLSLEGAEIPGLLADGLRVDGRLYLDGLRSQDTVRLLDARVDSDVDLDNAQLTSDSGPALNADGLHTGGRLRLENAHLAGNGGLGALILLNARIGNQLLLGNARIISSANAAVMAVNLRAESDVLLSDAHISGEGLADGIKFARAKISGVLDLNRLEIEDVQVALNLEDCCAGAVFLEPRLLCPDATHRSTPTVLLTGFTFSGLVGTSWREWLHAIREHTPSYMPQPYQQLAAVERASGHDGNARRILIAQQQDLYRRSPKAIGGWWTRRFHQLFGLLAGYGYRARRTALALLIALVVAGALGFWAGHVVDGTRHAAERPNGDTCSTVELIGVGLDRGLPLSPTGIRTRCDLNTGTTWGQVFTVGIWAVQAAVWGLATLALAGYTGLVRKTA